MENNGTAFTIQNNGHESVLSNLRGMFN